MTALLSRPKPQGFQLAQKGPAVLPPLRPGRLKGGVKGALRQASNLRQPVPGHPHQGGAKHGQQGDILLGVVYDLEPGEGH